MKKQFFRRRPLCALLIFALVFAAYGVFLLIAGRSYTVYVNYDPAYICKNAEIRFGENGERTESDIAEVSSIEIRNGCAKAKIVSKAKGEDILRFTAYSYEGDKNVRTNSAADTIRVGAGGLIFNNPYRHVYVVLSVLSLLLLVYYILCFVHTVKTKRFSYDTLFCLSVVLFLALLLFVWGGASVYSFTQYHTTSSQLIYSVNRELMTVLTIATLPLMLIFVVSVSVSNIELIRREGFRPTNALGLITSVVMLGGLCCIALLYILNKNYDKTILKVAYSVLTSLYILFEDLLASAILYGVYCSRRTPSYDKDYIIILGCMIKPDGTLYPLIRGRVDKAVEFYRRQLEKTGKEAYFVPSGGQGDDECMPEAEAMKNYLLSVGIPEERILPETKSATTKENMRFSKDIIDAREDNARIVFSTTSYHVFRSGAIACENGIDADGIGSKTKWYFWPNAFLREVAGIFVNQPKRQLLITLLIALSAGIGSYIYSLF